jgi:hypothetical protein
MWRGFEMKKTVVLGILVVLLLACVGAVSANLVTNGGFEKPLVTSTEKWDIFPNGAADLIWDVQWVVPGPVSGRPDPANAELQQSGIVLAGETINAFEGSQYAELDSDWNGHVGNSPVPEPSNVVMSQTILGTTPGKHYTISWRQRQRQDDLHNPSQLAFSWNGDGPVITSSTTGSWALYSEDRIAGASAPVISFAGYSADSLGGDSLGALIDDVRVEQVPDIPVPEFPTVALPAALIVGLLGAVLFIQSTKKN